MKKEAALRAPAHVREAKIAEDGFLDLEEIIATDEDGASTFEVTHNLVGVSIFSNFEEKRDLARRALSGFWGATTEVLTMTTPEEIFTYLRFNGIEEATFFVGSFPNCEVPIERPPTAIELNALRIFAAMRGVRPGPRAGDKA